MGRGRGCTVRPLRSSKRPRRNAAAVSPECKDLSRIGRTCPAWSSEQVQLHDGCRGSKQCAFPLQGSYAERRLLGYKVQVRPLPSFFSRGVEESERKERGKRRRWQGRRGNMWERCKRGEPAFGVVDEERRKSSSLSPGGPIRRRGEESLSLPPFLSSYGTADKERGQEMSVEKFDQSVKSSRGEISKKERERGFASSEPSTFWLHEKER